MVLFHFLVVKLRYLILSVLDRLELPFMQAGRVRAGAKIWIRQRSSVDAIYVPALGIAAGRSRLTNMGRRSIEVAASLFRQRAAERIVFSHAYGDFWQVEEGCKLEIAHENGVDESVIDNIRPEPGEGVTNTHREVERFGDFARGRGIRSVIVVLEDWHSARALLALRLGVPELEIFVVTFTPVLYEAHEASPGFKGWSTTELLWPLWNIIFYILTPFIQKRVAQ